LQNIDDLPPIFYAAAQSCIFKALVTLTAEFIKQYITSGLFDIPNCNIAPHATRSKMFNLIGRVRNGASGTGKKSERVLCAWSHAGWEYATIAFQQFQPRGSTPFGRYQIILLGDRHL